MSNDWTQSAADHALLDGYRDRNVFEVYRCQTCGFRGIGASVTLHPHEHGPMVSESRCQMACDEVCTVWATTRRNGRACCAACEAEYEKAQVEHERELAGDWRAR